LLAIVAFFFWRRNRDKKARLAARKGEIEDYGFDPNAMDGAGATGAASAAPVAAAGAGAGATVGTTPEMRQTYGRDDVDGYRGWGPTSSNAKFAPGAAVGTAAGAAAYYGHHRDNSNGAYEPYPPQNQGDYYYPDEVLDHHEGDGPDRYDNTLGTPYERDPNVYRRQNRSALGVVNSDLQRAPSNASSRYSTVSADENAGRSYQSSPHLQQNPIIQSQTGQITGRPGRSTMGGVGESEDSGEHGGSTRYDAVNF
jgi:hypothetical protein